MNEKKFTSAEKTTPDNTTGRFTEIEVKIKTCDTEIQNYVAALYAENRKIERKSVKCLVENISLKNRIAELETELKKCVENSHKKNKFDDMTLEELYKTVKPTFDRIEQSFKYRHELLPDKKDDKK